MDSVEKENSKAATTEPAPTKVNATTVPVSADKAGKGGNKGLLIVGGILLFCCVCCILPVGILAATGGLNASFNLGNLTSPSTTQLENNINDLINDNLNGGDSGSSDNGSTASDAPAAPGNPELGASKTAGDWGITLHSVKKDGDTYILDMSLKNNDTTTATFSTILQMRVSSSKKDSYSQDFFFDRDDADLLDGEIAAGETRRGLIAFDINDNPSDLKLVVKEGFLSDVEASFRLM